MHVFSVMRYYFLPILPVSEYNHQSFGDAEEIVEGCGIYNL